MRELHNVCMLVLLTYFHEAVVVEEAEHGGAGGRGVAEPHGGDVGDDLVDRRARLGVEVQRQLVPDRRPPAAGSARAPWRRRHLHRQWQRRLPSKTSADEGHDERKEQEGATEAGVSGGIHCHGGGRSGGWK